MRCLWTAVLEDMVQPKAFRDNGSFLYRLVSACSRFKQLQFREERPDCVESGVREGKGGTVSVTSCADFQSSITLDAVHDRKLA